MAAFLEYGFGYAWMAASRILPCWSFGRPAETGICGRDGQEYGIEARRRKRNAASAPALAAQRKDRTHLRGSSLQGREVAMPAPRHHQSRVVSAADKDPKDNPRFVITNMKQSPHGFTSRSTACAVT